MATCCCTRTPASTNLNEAGQGRIPNSRLARAPWHGDGFWQQRSTGCVVHLLVHLLCG